MPISIISAFGKFLDKLVCKQLHRYFNRFKIFYRNQFGFRSGYDTSYLLLNFTDNTKEALNLKDKIYNISVFIDLKKEFNTVHLDKLIIKLQNYGVRVKEHSWFKSY